ncbi:unnamed protein product [Penicillium salamii]|uniref:F-box domain-containing protein n=1 Tax=Penicillium salamii TaxID=1612424 RepID=A0A9W4I4X6_9EURO|nr:unnamed protein product [Penicillium salamii]CAG8086722.1 unnamed protein product [Penicillium salamii]CAG8102552.1 unnamed protein product [Penicillium salamii]CAG8103852.1 unnamed protein product [Penicillium salamii]CAG8119940.1 unnamed protein product [Penicillium salamii]
MAATAGYINVPALRSSNQDYAYGPAPNPVCMEQTTITQAEVEPVPTQQIPESKLNENTPVANSVPPEILLQIFSLLYPKDFNSARHTCSRWMRVSLNERLLERKLKSAGWWNAWLQDHSKPSAPGRDESDVWRMSRRLATESLFSSRKSRSRPKNLGFVKTTVIDFSGLVGTERKSRAIGPQSKDIESNKPVASTFSASSCSNYLLVTIGCTIQVYRLLGRRKDSNDANLVPISTITCPHDVLSTAIDTSTPKPTIAALLSNRVGMLCKLDTTKTKATPHHLFHNICSEEDPPQTVALSPGRPLVAFGCASNIEIHTMNNKRNEVNKPFTLPQPSEVLHFLPSTAEAPKELRLISSLAGPTKCKCPPVPKPQFHFLADVQSFSRRRISYTPSRNMVRATHCHHYHAVPINDGLHMAFVEPQSNLLCIGSDAPIGGLTSLTRSFICLPPFISSKSDKVRPPSTFAIASDLRWGLRLVAVYGSRLVLYSIPGDIWNIVRRDREKQVNGFMGDDISRHFCAEADAYMESLDSYQPPPMVWPLRVRGREIGSVSGVVELSLQCGGGGVRVWAFGKSGMGEVFDVDTGDLKEMAFGVDVGGVKMIEKENPVSGNKKRKFEEDVTFAGRYGVRRVERCRTQGHQRKSSFAACVIDFKAPDLE